MIFDQIVYTPRVFKWNSILEKVSFIDNMINHNYFLTFLKLLFLISITFFPLCLGIRINKNPTIISYISQVCYGIGIVIFYSSIIKYGYIFPNFNKRYFLTFVYGMIISLVFINFVYPNIFSKFLTVFSKNFMDLAVISLTFILMTATLALLVFTYNTVLEHLKCKKILRETGRLYSIATIYVILFSIVSFSFFFLLKIFGITKWDSFINYNPVLFIELNVICIMIFLLTYFVVNFLENFIFATWFSLEAFIVDCY